jgi:hypothetical protein
MSPADQATLLMKVLNRGLPQPRGDVIELKAPMSVGLPATLPI